MSAPSEFESLVAKAERGDRDAQYELGWRYALGQGLPEDDAAALRWLTEAAARGHMLAQNNLGARFYSGDGVPQDLVQAFQWFELAARQGDRKASKNRDAIAGQMTPAQKEEALRRVEDFGRSPARFRAVVVKHGYASIQIERELIERAGGELIDAGACSEEETLRACEGADGILVRWMRITPEVIGRLGRCKIIVRYGVGVDNVDVSAATEAGILVGHVPHYCTDEVAAHAFALWLGCVRHTANLHIGLTRGGWNENPAEKMRRTAGKTFGLIGLGNIGQSMARKLSGWSLKLLAHDPYAEPERARALGVELADLKTLCQESDFISLHLPLLPETRHSINAETFSWMKEGVILVNTARGPIIDQAALAEALAAGRVGWAGLDVFEEEPLPPDSPLRAHPRVVLSDHVAWYSEEAEHELRRTAAEELIAACHGRLPDALANPEVLERLGRAKEWTPNSTARWQLKRLGDQRLKTKD